MASFDPVNSTDDQILVEEHGLARTVVLNRPKQLNSFSPSMMSRLLETFLAFEQDPNVELIILKGNGRAFCAGGDVTTVVGEVQKDWRSGANFFTKQYSLNYVMATYSKIQVSLLDGIVMGGGAGASIHGRFRVATENTVFAMPENAIGLFPDVGASYFLSRLPGFFGEYLGLTGTRLDGAEMLMCGLATHFIPSKKLPLLEKDLCNIIFTDWSNISKTIDKYAKRPVVKGSSPFHQLYIIDKCFSCVTIEEILSSLETEATMKNDDWISKAIHSIKKAFPTSLKICLRSIREGRFQGIGQCLIREYRMICHVMKGDLSRDIFEGRRAIFVDKDKNPKWEPSRLDLVSDRMVKHYFSRVDDKEWEDLKFPPRPKLVSLTMARL